MAWELLVHADTWPLWSAIDSASVDRASRSDPAVVLASDGVGDLRTFVTGNIVSQERITSLEPERRLAYEMVPTGLFKSYEGEITLLPSNSGTMIRWRATFRGRYGSGLALQLLLRRYMQRMVNGLARHAETQA